MKQISAEAREALDHLRPGDRVALMVFAKGTAVAQGFSDNLAETARNIGGAVKNWDVGSSTMINSAVRWTPRVIWINMPAQADVARF